MPLCSIDVFSLDVSAWLNGAIPNSVTNKKIYTQQPAFSNFIFCLLFVIEIVCVKNH